MRRTADYWAFIIKELRSALQLGEMIASLVISVVAGAVAGFTPLPIWSVPLVAVGFLFLSLLILTPPYVREKDQQRIDDLASQLDEIARQRPRFQLSDPILDSLMFHSSNSPQRPGRLYRLKVVNIGEIAAERTEVRITASRPAIRGGIPTWLHQTDANIDHFARDFVLPPGEEAGKFIDVVFALDDEPRTIYVYHAISPDWDGKLTEDAYQLTVTVSAATKGAQTHSRRYEVKVDDADWLKMDVLD